MGTLNMLSKCHSGQIYLFASGGHEINLSPLFFFVSGVFVPVWCLYGGPATRRGADFVRGERPSPTISPLLSFRQRRNQSKIVVISPAGTPLRSAALCLLLQRW